MTATPEPRQTTAATNQIAQTRTSPSSPQLLALYAGIGVS